MEVITVQADVSDEAQVKAAIEAGVHKWGRIDYAANCAGIGGPVAKFVDVDVAEVSKLSSTVSDAPFVPDSSGTRR